MTAYELPAHISYSQLNTYNECPRSWYLRYLRKAEELQTWYIPIGSAAHSMVEDWLEHDSDQQSIKAEDYFYPLISAQMEIEPDLSKWLAGGPKGYPVTEGKALQMVKNCFERALEFLEDIDVWEVEYDASGSLPGLSVPIKAYVDIVGEHKRHGPLVDDWKTGSAKPGNFQLLTYGARLKLDPRYKGINFKGRYAMLKPDSPNTRPIDLSAVDPAEIGAKYQAARDGMESMMIQAKKKFMCKMCLQRDNCIEQSGPTARSLFYDRSRYDQPPF